MAIGVQGRPHVKPGVGGYTDDNSLPVTTTMPEVPQGQDHSQPSHTRRRAQGQTQWCLVSADVIQIHTLLTWYQEYARSAGLMRMVRILALGNRVAARRGATSESK